LNRRLPLNFTYGISFLWTLLYKVDFAICRNAMACSTFMYSCSSGFCERTASIFFSSRSTFSNSWATMNGRFSNVASRLFMQYDFSDVQYHDYDSKRRLEVSSVILNVFFRHVSSTAADLLFVY